MARSRWLMTTVLTLTPLTAAPAFGQAAMPVAVAADTPATTAATTFTIPQAWALTTRGALSLLTPPETDTHLVIADVGTATDAAAAAKRAWALYRPDFNRPTKVIVARAPKSGWDERQLIDYESSANEKVDVQAFALRRGPAWTVILIDSSQATGEKRGAAMNQIIASVRPVGYTRESFAGRAAQPLTPERIEQLRSFVATSIAQLGVPGAGIALIDGGKIVYEGGVGVKALGKPDPVDAHTLFMIASNTKGMATLLLAKMVDEGKVGWDQPVTQVYPSFRLGSDTTTRNVLIRHLVCACTGLPRKDFDWIFNTRRSTPASTTFTQLAATEPTSDFGEVFQYNNLMATAAGYVAGHLAYPQMEIGKAFDTAMQTYVFMPLQMTDTTFDYARAQRGNFAQPHGDDPDGKPMRADMAFNYSIAPYRPAGGAFSSAHDVALYVQNELSEGRLPSGKPMISAAPLLQRRVPGVPTGEDQFYGMGLETNRIWGVPVVHHGGSMDGYKTDLMFLPEAGIGAVILTNADNGQALLRPFMRRLMEVVYDGKPEAAADVAAAATALRATRANERARLAIPADRAVAATLAPRYVNADLGTIAVSRKAAGTDFDFGLWGSMVATRKNDDGTISFVTIDPTEDGFEFVQGSKDGKRTLTTRDSQHEYVYTEAR